MVVNVRQKNESLADDVDIFIVYQKRDMPVLLALKELFECWGFSVFYCRDEKKNPHGKEYRDTLKENFLAATVVLLVLSESFKSCKYCQSEAGATATLDKAQITVMLPPLEKEMIGQVAPILTGQRYSLAIPSEQFVSELIEHLSGIFEKPIGRGNDSEAIAKLFIELRNNHAFYLSQAPVRTFNVWPSLEDPHAVKSIKKQIVDKVEASTAAVDIYVVGVSLKFSLNLLTEAFREFRFTNPTPFRKRVNLQLVHMSEYAYVLHALRDETDISCIKQNMVNRWEKVQDEWRECCNQQMVELSIEKFSIDYIPHE